MTKPASEAPSTEPAEPQKKDQLSDQQLDDVAGAGGRQLTDCEGFAVLGNQTLGASSSPKVKLPE